MGPIGTTSPGNAYDSRQAQQNISTEQAAYNRSVASAAGAVNQSGILGDNREVTFSVDQSTHKPVIRVLDANTREVIDQWPPEYLLQMAAQTKLSERDSG
jgi:uncharacterized FlaG/YvyC family protein